MMDRPRFSWKFEGKIHRPRNLNPAKPATFERLPPSSSGNDQRGTVGLKGMHERGRELGGKLDIDFGPGRGRRIGHLAAAPENGQAGVAPLGLIVSVGNF